MDNKNLGNILEESFNQNIPVISPNIHYWMIRSKKGFFYHEYIKDEFVALGYNTIDKNTNLNVKFNPTLPDQIKKDHPHIKQTTKVINKCNYFINDIQINDLIIIPNSGTEEITIALAGDYFEDDTATIEKENEISYRIEKEPAAMINVKCPYKKRRHIIPLRSIKTKKINYHLYQTLRNYNGIDDVDEHAVLILSLIFDIFIYQGDLHISLFVNQSNDIGLTDLSGFLYGSGKYFSHFFDSSKVTTKVNVSSEGPILFTIKNIIDFFVDHGQTVFNAFLILITSQKLINNINDLPEFLKRIFTLKSTVAQEKINTELKKEELRTKRLENEKLELELKKEKEKEKAKILDATKQINDDNYLEDKINRIQTQLIDASLDGMIGEDVRDIIQKCIIPLEITPADISPEKLKLAKDTLSETDLFSQ
ncbi:hypothetical protein [Diplocloster modestus]|uniref:Uncharacterized protein n=1 Tax=Diplocloster modestus TaxID=2850322 RepID=A0ABS6K1A0_9FIRM|nr:hypothetical protein [Diplocloster modestus]MBU9724503.1 hypothetical protein [Diplocloster modestus]